MITGRPVRRVGALAGQLAGGAAGAGLAIGIVTAWTSGQITVRISGSDDLVDAARLADYRPDLGDYVLVASRGATWTVLGAYGGLPDNNKVANPSFEADGDISATVPTGWTHHHTGGSGNMATDVGTAFISQIDGPDGIHCLALHIDTGDATGVIDSVTDTVSSDPVAVDPGQRWAASGHALWDLSGQNADGVKCTGSLSIYGFADTSTVYPSGTGLAGTGSQELPFAPPWRFFRVSSAATGDAERVGVLIPDGIAYIRAVARSQVTVTVAGLHGNSGGMSTLWDRILLRQIS